MESVNVWMRFTVDCKTVRIQVRNAWAVKQKVWNEAEDRERDLGRDAKTGVWGKTLTARFTDFFTDFQKKTDCFARSLGSP